MRTTTLLTVAVWIFAVSLSHEARADEKAACLEAASKGQTLRDAHQLVEARDALRVCAREGCPTVVQKDCAGWLEAVEKALPTVVLTAKDGAGADLVNVRVFIDGRALVTSLDGKAVPMNPGPHTFHFEALDGTSTDQQVLLPEGAQARSVAVVLGRPPQTPIVPVAPTAPTPALATVGPAPGALYVSFVVPNKGERWRLMKSKEEPLCDLPCSQWVPPKSGFFLQLDADKLADVKTVKLPDDLGYSPRRKVEAVLGTRTPSGTKTLLWVGGILVPLAAVGIAGAVALCPSSQCGSDPSEIGNTVGGVVAGLLGGIAAIGGVTCLGIGIARLGNEESYVDIHLPVSSTSASLRLGPGFMRVGDPAKGTGMLVSPFGMTGSF
jgi:hypothetical protein